LGDTVGDGETVGDGVGVGGSGGVGQLAKARFGAVGDAVGTAVAEGLT
jgi:hypothetical protein